MLHQNLFFSLWKISSRPLITAFMRKFNYEKVQRLVYSHSSDLIYGATQGEILMLKRFLVGLGIHNLTEHKLPIKILSRIGRSAEYKTVCQLETAQAEVVQFLYDRAHPRVLSLLLMILPKCSRTFGQTILTRK